MLGKTGDAALQVGVHLQQQARRLTVVAALDHTIGRVRGLAADAHCLQGPAVQDGPVARAVDKADRVQGGGFVQVPAVGVASFFQRPIVVGPASNPRAAGRRRRPLRQGALDLRNGRCGMGGAVHGHQARRQGQEMEVRVLEAGKEAAALAVDEPGVRAPEVREVAGAAHEGNAPAFKRHQLRHGLSRVQGANGGVIEDEAGVRHCTGGGGKMAGGTYRGGPPACGREPSDAGRPAICRGRRSPRSGSRHPLPPPARAPSWAR